MTNYLISVELHDKHHEPALLAALEVFEDRIQAMTSLWFVYTPWSAEQVRAYLGRHLGPDDSLIVEPLTANRGRSSFIREDVRAWLEKHLGPPC